MGLLNRMWRDWSWRTPRQDADARYAEAMSAGCRHQAAGRYEAAIDCFSRALTDKPDSAEALVCRGTAWLSCGQAARAAEDAADSLVYSDTPPARAVFLSSIGVADAVSSHPAIIRCLARALDESWGSPEKLAEVAIVMLKRDRVVAATLRELAAVDRGTSLQMPSVALGGNGLLMALLAATPVCDAELERLLCALRRTILDALAVPRRDDELLPLACALARQCFINEYVFALDAPEREATDALAVAVEAVLVERRQPDALLVAVLACYRPIHCLTGATALLDGRWPVCMEPLLDLQLREPLEERRLHPSIRAVTAIEDAVSERVRRQYEENPYPRWIRLGPTAIATGLNEYLLSRLPHAECSPGGAGQHPKVLVAGCGTGRHAIQLACCLPQASIVALDLSRASLAYAMRKSRELGVENVEYVQGDILAVAALGRGFDLVESVGVLHHMRDPVAGWRLLLECLRPGGIMAVGLYSARARRHITTIRQLIADKGYGDSAEEIRRCRAELLGPGPVVAWRFQSADFYSLSACRDLLFHVQEHYFSLPWIATFFTENKLRFLGFTLPAEVLARYAARYPDDKRGTDLACWDRFEAEFPDTFAHMYQFYLQKM